MRSFLVTLLAGLLLACPFLCGADEIGHGAQHEAATGDAGQGHSPDQCPEGSDSCVCRGAVQANDVRLVSPDSMASGPLFVFVPQACVLPPAHHLALGGSATGLAGWGNALTVRAYLQNFRF